jgi:hypothetical protein
MRQESGPDRNEDQKHDRRPRRCSVRHPPASLHFGGDSCAKQSDNQCPSQSRVEHRMIDQCSFISRQGRENEPGCPNCSIGMSNATKAGLRCSCKQSQAPSPSGDGSPAKERVKRFDPIIARSFLMMPQMISIGSRSGELAENRARGPEGSYFARGLAMRRPAQTLIQPLNFWVG